MNYSPRNQIAAGEIRAHLGRRRETIRTLAEATGIAESTLKRRLLGRSPFTLDELHSIAVHFNVPLTTLIEYREAVA